MSLYDDVEDKTLSGWASGIKFLQHQIPKRVASAQAKSNQVKKQSAQLAPVIDLNKSSKSNKDDLYESTTSTSSSFTVPFSVRSTTTVVKESRRKPGKHNNNKSFSSSSYLSVDSQWQFENEYDPLYPNDYEKALRDLRERRDKEAEEEENKRRNDENRDDEENYIPTSKPLSAGAAIAPPASLSQSYDSDRMDTSPGNMGGGGGGGSGGGNFGLGIGSGANAAARIMAKYGYKEGQGLGKKEQGMSTALQVEKTSHRTGRIIHERDEPRGFSSFPEPTAGSVTGTVPLSLAQYNDDEEIMEEPPSPIDSDPLRNPSKVVLLKNMVGPGEVDDDLEPEVKDECNTKYGQVNNVTVFQMPDMDGDDAIRIFVEFERVDSAMKALVDLNGRFFGGRQVKALFYDYDKYTNLELID